MNDQELVDQSIGPVQYMAKIYELSQELIIARGKIHDLEARLKFALEIIEGITTKSPTKEQHDRAI